VRDEYGQALLRAQAHGTSPGWVDRALELTSFSQPDSYDDGGIPMSGSASRATWTPFERVFDADVFTAWYVEQPGLANQAFADHYGTSRTIQISEANTEFGGPAVTRMAFDNPNWTLDWSVGGSGLGNSNASFTHKELAHLNLNDPPDLHHVEAVGFDFDAGWSTAQANVARDADWLETAAEVAFIVGVGIVTSGAMAGFGFGGTSLGAVVATGAAVGGTTSIASGFIHDNLSLKNVLRGALSGALTAGLLNGIESALGPLSYLGKVAASTGVQGLVQAGLGGSFKDGALAGFASGLGQQIVASMSDGIKAAVAAGTMTPVQAAAAQTMARMLGSAIRVAASPGDPGQAFANAFLSDVMGQIDVRQPGQAAPGSQAAFDDNGRALPATPVPAVAVGLNPTQLVEAPVAVFSDVTALPSDWEANAEVGGGQSSVGIDEQIDDADQMPLNVGFDIETQNSADELAARKLDIEKRLAFEIQEQEALDSSNGDGQMVLTGGPVRNLTRGGIGNFETVRHGNWDAALNIGADALGVLPDLAGLQQDLAKIDRMQTESRINEMRLRMIDAGMKNVPTGYSQDLLSNGAVVRNYGATVNDLQTHYEAFVRDSRLKETWGEGYQTLRIGKSQMTVLEFEKRVLDVQQSAANKYYEKGIDLIAKGTLPINGDFARTLGNYMDANVRFSLRGLAFNEGINDSMASNLWGRESQHPKRIDRPSRHPR
jgi:hypothetical protein